MRITGKVLLSSFAGLADFTVLRDGEFQNLGFLIDHRPEMLSFLESERYLPALLKNNAVCAVVAAPELMAKIPARLALAVCDQPRIGFAKLHNCLTENGFYWQDHATVIHPDAKVHPRAFVAERNVKIGPETTVGPNATLLERCIIGAGVQIGAGAVLGGVGFQTARTSSAILEMSHAGGLVVEDGVQILQGAVIATGLFRNNTELGRDARIGAQSFLSHGVQVGERAFVGHGSVINGNVILGREAWIGPGAVIAQNLHVCDGASVSLGSVVIRHVKTRTQVSGNFAITHRRLLRHLASVESDNGAV